MTIKGADFQKFGYKKLYSMVDGSTIHQLTWIDMESGGIRHWYKKI